MSKPKIIVHVIAILILLMGWNSYFNGKKSDKVAVDVAKKMEQWQTVDEATVKEEVKKASGTEASLMKALLQDIKGKEYDSTQIFDALRDVANKKRDNATFFGVLMTMLSAAYAGICFVAYVLPALAHRATSEVFGSDEEVGADPMRDARGKVAQGDYEGAIASFREAAAADQTDRMPWVEIIKIQRDTLEDPAAAVASIQEALAAHTWPESDDAFFLFRMAEINDADLGNRDAAVDIMRQVMEKYPETRHSANARHKLHEWGVV